MSKEFHKHNSIKSRISLLLRSVLHDSVKLKMMSQLEKFRTNGSNAEGRSLVIFKILLYFFKNYTANYWNILMLSHIYNLFLSIDWKHAVDGWIA